MTFGLLLSVLRARWKVALSVLLTIVVLTVIVSLIWPKSYKAEASIVMDVKPDPVSAMMYGGLTSPAFMQTQVDIISSDRVAMRVVRNLKLADSAQVRENWQESTGGEGSIESWLAGSLERGMDVKPSRESNVITVSYKAPDPRFAAALANGFVQAYLDTSLELRVDPAKQYSTFFDTRSKEAREALEKAQTKLSDFQRDKGIIATDERVDVESARLNELSSQLVMQQTLSAESGSRQAQAADASKAERMQEVLGNPVIAGLKSDIARGEAHLQELNSRYGENHPQVVEAKANLAELRARMDSETRRVTGGVGISANINRARESEIRAELEAQRAQVLKMKATRDEGQVLTRDVENAQRAYDAVMTRLSQSSLESQTTQGSAYVLTQAVAPTSPATPRVGLNTLIAVFLGTLIALGVVMLMEFLDRRVRNMDDVIHGLGLPVLGILPVTRTASRLPWRRKPSQMQYRVIGQLPAPQKGS